MSDWHLECSACDHTGSGDTLASVCPSCGQPLLVRYDSPWPARDAIVPRWDLWRYRAVLPLREEGNVLVLASESDLDPVSSAALGRKLKRSVRYVIVPKGQVTVCGSTPV